MKHSRTHNKVTVCKNWIRFWNLVNKFVMEKNKLNNNKKNSKNTVYKLDYNWWIWSSLLVHLVWSGYVFESLFVHFFSLYVIDKQSIFRCENNQFLLWHNENMIWMSHSHEKWIILVCHSQTGRFNGKNEENKKENPAIMNDCAASLVVTLKFSNS